VFLFPSLSCARERAKNESRESQSGQIDLREERATFPLERIEIGEPRLSSQRCNPASIREQSKAEKQAERIFDQLKLAFNRQLASRLRDWCPNFIFDVKVMRDSRQAGSDSLKLLAKDAMLGHVILESPMACAILGDLRFLSNGAS
jgi:hypothetical protein